MSYDVELDKATFDAIVCDCYRKVHPPLSKAKVNGVWKQVPYHYGTDWEMYHDMGWLEKIGLKRLDIE